MSGFLLECPYPDATTCLVLGAVNAAGAARLRGFRSVLCLETAPLLPPPAGMPVTVERLALPAPEDLPAVIDRFVARDPRRLPTLLVSAHAPSSPLLQQAVSQIHGQLEGHHRARFTRQQDGFRWQRHVLANLPAYLRHRVPDTWRNRLAGRPAFICGAGPSLDVSVARLAAFVGAGVVFAADSAVRGLARHGVQPDFIVSIDAAKLPEKCLVAGEPVTACVVLSTVSPPDWWRSAAPGRCVFLSGRQVTEDWLERLGAAKSTPRVTENCGATALELARYLGCAPIYLFGMDLALDESQGLRRHHDHVDATTYAHSGFNAAQRHPRVPGNFAESVPTHVVGDLRALNDRLATWPAGLVVNVTDRGARIQNTVVCPPEQFRPSAGSPTGVRPLNRLPLPIGAETGELLSSVQRVGAKAPALAALAAQRLASGYPAAAAEVLRAAMLDRDLSRLLGAYGLRLMPHLVPPLEGDASQWRQFVTEFAELADAAAAIGRDG